MNKIPPITGLFAGCGMTYHASEREILERAGFYQMVTQDDEDIALCLKQAGEFLEEAKGASRPTLSHKIAHDLYEQAFEIDPFNEEAIVGMAKCRTVLAVGDTVLMAEARALCAEAIAMFPDTATELQPVIRQIDRYNQAILAGRPGQTL